MSSGKLFRRYLSWLAFRLLEAMHHLITQGFVPAATLQIPRPSSIRLHPKQS